MAPVLGAQEADAPATLEGLSEELRALREGQRNQRHAFDRLAKAVGRSPRSRVARSTAFWRST